MNEKTLAPVFLSLWLALFAAEAWGVARWAQSLSRTGEALETAGAQLAQSAERTTAALGEARTLERELEFLQALPNILPQDKGYLRTQKAIAGDVRLLRRQLAKKVAGQTYVLVDAKANKLYLKKGFQLLWEADCSVGRGGVLLDKKTGRRWEFVTPRGELKVVAKGKDPLWKKPDWAYVESGEPIPPPDDPARLVSGELGPFVLNLGDGYLIHGTKNEDLLGRPASHGCVRLGGEFLERLYQQAALGTKVYIFY